MPPVKTEKGSFFAPPQPLFSDVKKEMFAHDKKEIFPPPPLLSFPFNRAFKGSNEEDIRVFLGRPLLGACTFGQVPTRKFSLYFE